MNALKQFLASRETVLLGIWILIMIGFGLTDPVFLDPYNLLDRSRHWVEPGLIAVAMTLIIATGGIDLSVGSILAFAGIVAGQVYQDLGWPLPLAIAAAIVTGLIAGAFNGLLIDRLRIPPLVATLATMVLYRGMAMGLCSADPISGFPQAFTAWGVMTTVGWGDWQFPYTTLMLLAVTALGVFLFRATRLGRRVVQIGENPRAARFAGVGVSWVTIGIYAASGLLCGLAAVSYTARFATAHPAAATGLELEVIACVVIGGTRITGGNGSVLGSFLGLLILGSLKYGMDLRGLLQQHQIVLIGLLLIVTAITNEWIARQHERRIRPGARNSLPDKGEPVS